MKNINKQRKASLMVLSFAMILAVYLNWQYAKGARSSYIFTDEQIQRTNAETEINESDMLMSSEDYETKNYGDAQLVATTQTDTEKYFEQARLSRQKTRDEALDTLQKALKNSKLTDREKKEATVKLSDIIQNMTSETDIENMVKAKGFSDCVASIADGKVSVAVRPVNGELTKSDVAKIRDVVLSKTTISSQNIVVVEVK
ncbi:MAG: SpoIIIAH-like family protein [Oscillospiraceae bacterium]|nr:SpoIIIAH-like family protein [Oscillospiraceae bacterium]